MMLTDLKDHDITELLDHQKHIIRIIHNSESEDIGHCADLICLDCGEILCEIWVEDEEDKIDEEKGGDS